MSPSAKDDGGWSLRLLPAGTGNIAGDPNTAIKRSDYGINYGLGEGQGGAVGNDVEITSLIEGIKLGPDGAPFRVQ